MKKCPLLKKDCIEGKCMFWTEFMMKKIESQEIDKVGNCAIAWIPQLLSEQNKNIIGVQAAVESRGNEQIKMHTVTNRIFAGIGQLALERHELQGPQEPKRLDGANPA